MACAVLPRPISSARMDPVIPCCFKSIKKFTPTTCTVQHSLLVCYAEDHHNINLMMGVPQPVQVTDTEAEQNMRPGA